MYFIVVLLAAISFTIGGIYMKFSQGLTELIPTLLVYFFFILGASLQALAMRDTSLGMTYVIVLGCEAVLALLFGVLLFKENYSLFKLLGVSLIVTGITFLRA
jgi:multidrug transporter EmrE-like cation transporter